MSEIDYSLSVRRRALNLIWTAAGEYRFEPEFMAFTQDGQPDIYMNSIIGYVRKWYGGPKLDDLFSVIGSALLRETFDGILWIGLENCAYEREVKERPVLAELRISCAEEFFRHRLERSRQQWMAQNSLVYALQSARWNTVLGKSPGLVSSRERNLFRELAYSGDWDITQIAEHTFDILHRYFHFDRNNSRSPMLAKVRSVLSSLTLRALPSRVMRSEDLTFARDASGAGLVTARKSKESGPLSAVEEENNRIYIEECFGLPMYGRCESAQIEELLCTDRHAGCHIYFTEGNRSSAESKDALIRKTIRGARLQAEKNRSHYRDRIHFYRNSIKRLSDQIRNALLVYPQPLKVPARSGSLNSARIWRAVQLNDERIFTDTFKEELPVFSVDLVLDASASRLQSQEIIAAQAYVIAKSLALCGIPVQVSSFLSLRGHTVIRLYQNYSGAEYSEGDASEHIFDYFAAGWNRDGLALRGIGFLMNESPAQNRMLILLTDASPNDDRKIPPDRDSGRLLSRDYSGEAGIEDTQTEVRSLRKSGIQVMAVLTGEDGSTEAARKIYGDDFVRIENIRHLADAVGTLLQRKIEQFTV